MKLYLASVIHDYCTEVIDDINTYVLESFYNSEKRYDKYYTETKDLLIDSGIYYFASKNKHTDFNSYCDAYIDFINSHNFNQFFEMDVDNLEGLARAEEYRERIESRTGKQVIPIWHISRGIDYYKGLVKDYPIVGIGAMSTKDLKTKDYHKLIPLIDYAHKYGTKVHGLGFTALKWLPRLKFDSVDSSSWSTGRRYGVVWGFDKTTGLMRQERPRVKSWDWRKITRHNYKQWRNFQKYVYSHY